MIKKDSKRVMITFDSDTLKQLEDLCRMFHLSKTNMLVSLIQFYTERLK